jgi:hypothetical protein
MPSIRPERVVISSHSLTQENCCRRQCAPCRIVVATTVDCSRASAFFSSRYSVAPVVRPMAVRSW